MKYCNYEEFLSYTENLYKIELKIVNDIFYNLEIDEEQEKYNYKKVENQIHNVHDISLRNILMNKREMAIFLNDILSLKNTRNQINENNLELCNQTFITKSFYNKQADIIYKRKDINVYFLVEHQSKVDYEMPKRILEYMIEKIREKYKKEGERESMLVDVLLQLKDEGLREGKREGRIEGKKEQLELIVKKMLKNNMNVELIKKLPI